MIVTVSDQPVLLQSIALVPLSPRLQSIAVGTALARPGCNDLRGTSDPATWLADGDGPLTIKEQASTVAPTIGGIAPEAAVDLASSMTSSAPLQQRGRKRHTYGIGCFAGYHDTEPRRLLKRHLGRVGCSGEP